LTLHDGGLLELRHTVTNEGTTPYQLDELATVLPVAPDAVELLDLTGRWCRENHPQRRAIQQGTWVRTGRHGRTGHDSSLLLAAGTSGFGNRHGKVWATHLAWSGNHEQFTDTIGDGRTVIGGSELLGPAEVILEPRGTLHHPCAVRRLLGAWPGRHQRGLLQLVPVPPAPRAAGCRGRQAAAGGAEHLGSRLLRPQPVHPD
jgi:alpha-galactosidase